MSKNSAVAPDSLDAKDTLAHQNSTSMSEKAELKNALSVHHSDKNEPHPDLAAGPMTYTDAEFNSAHLTDNERALHGRSDNVDGAFVTALFALTDKSCCLLAGSPDLIAVFAAALEQPVCRTL